MLLDTYFERLGALISKNESTFRVVNELLSILVLSDEIRRGLIVALLLDKEF